MQTAHRFLGKQLSKLLHVVSRRCSKDNHRLDDKDDSHDDDGGGNDEALALGKEDPHPDAFPWQRR